MAGGTATRSSKRRRVSVYLEQMFRNPSWTGDTGGVLGADSAPGRGFITLPSGGMDATPDISADEEHDGFPGQRRQVMESKTYEGGFPFKADPENLYYPLLSLSGNDYQTLAQEWDGDDFPNVYKHAFSDIVFHLPSFCVEDVLDTVTGMVDMGVVARQLQLQFGKTVQATWDLIGHGHIPNTYPDGDGADTAYVWDNLARGLPPEFGFGGGVTLLRTSSPNFVDVSARCGQNGPLVFAGMKYGSRLATSFITINGDAVEAVLRPGFSLTFNPELETGQVSGGGYDPTAPSKGRTTVMGTGFQFLYYGPQLSGAALEFACIALNFKIFGGTIGTTGLKYATEVYLPKVKFHNTKVDRSGKALLVTTDFQAEVDPVLGYSYLIELWNRFDNSVLGGRTGIVTTLDGGVESGDTVITLDDVTGLKVFDNLRIGAYGSQEVRRITGIAGANVTLSAALSLNHANAANVQTEPGGLGGWSNYG